MMRTLRSALKMYRVTGVVRLAWRRVLRSRANCYSAIQPLVSGKMGLEVGGPSPIFSRRGLLPVYPVAKRVDNCNFSNSTIWEGTIREGRTFVFDPQHEPGNQYLVEATDLGPIEAETYDFVLSSHTLEHIANPLRALAAFGRVLKSDGLLVLVLPHKQETFDHRRPLTTMAHLIDDHVMGTAENDMTHLTEILSWHDLARDPGIDDTDTFGRRCRQNLEIRCMHHHVFDTSLAVEMADWLGLQIVDAEPTLPHHIILVCRKSAQPGQNALFLSDDAPFRESSPFTLDRR
jgi:SAM-dependent methyltransferase